MQNIYTLSLTLLAAFGVCLPSIKAGKKTPLPVPVRIASGVAGHIHPAVCQTKSGTIIVIFSQKDRVDLRVARSKDGGKTWSTPEPFPHTVKKTLYPGSLTTLPDGRVVHAWNRWYVPEGSKIKSRYVEYSVSSNEGQTWSEPKQLAKNKIPSIIRHPLVPLARDSWLLSLADRTVVYNPKTGQETPFGDGQVHGLVPIVRTPRGTFISGKGLRSTDDGKTWQKIKGFPDIATQGWRHDLVCLDNGWLIASRVLGPDVGGSLWQHIVSRDDGVTWDTEHPTEFYHPGRPIGGRACPKTLLIDEGTLGTVFYDVSPSQPGGAGVFYLRFPLSRLK